MSVVEQLAGKSGWLMLSKVAIAAMEQEEHLVFAAQDDDGNPVAPDVCAKLFGVDGEVDGSASVPANVVESLRTISEKLTSDFIEDIGKRNAEYFESEMEKLEKWAEDLKQQLEAEIRELDREIKEVKKGARKEPDLDKKVALHKQAKDLEARRKAKRKSLFDAQDQVDEQKEDLIGKVEARLRQTVEKQEVFMVKWRVS